ncbi:HNH endonuclease [Longivirga aurantiaca]|uniref:DUF222 domain-containing protein n=1 Tax=Longivirga aurantiaca TaxID=1837743 RepID=A0ABW1SZY1_9ACTN
MSSSRGSSTSETVVSAVDALLAGLVQGLERFVVEGLEADYARPAAWSPVLGSLQLDVDVPGHRRPARTVGEPEPAPVREPDERAVRLAQRRAARAAALREQVEARFVPGTDSSRMWALALGLVDAQDLNSPVAAPDLLEDLTRLDRDVDRAHGRRYAALAAIAGIPDPRGAVSSENDRQIAHEVAIAVGMSIDAAAHHISTARSLFGELAPFGHALLEGEVSDWHCRTLISECLNITDPDTLEVIGRLALPAARTMVVADFRTHLQALITELDPDAVRRHQKAHDDRGLYIRRGKDGMSFLGLTHDTPVIDAIYDTLRRDGDAIADQRHRDNDTAAAAAAAESDRATEPVWSDADLRADAARADALMARILGTVTPDGEVTFDRAAATIITTDVVIDADTLQGLQDRVALINGQPAPAGIARDHAAWATFLRRVVTDPVDGWVKDHGTTVRVPPALRRHCIARDGGCRSPGCTRKAQRYLQIDHAEEAPHGPTTAGNCGALCTECHQRKTAGLLDITDSRPDGTATFNTALGQTVRIPARPNLPRPHTVHALAVEIDQPPF